jgi:hypothetical protein
MYVGTYGFIYVVICGFIDDHIYLLSIPEYRPKSQPPYIDPTL